MNDRPLTANRNHEEVANMHGGEFQHRSWTPGRGFIASMSEPEPEPADPAGPEAAPGPPEGWDNTHAALTSNYEGRLAAHNRQAAKVSQSQQRRSDWDWAQRQQTLGTGSLGFKRFWKGRSELTGTPSYNANWLSMGGRPSIHEGFGPYSPGRVGSMIERRTTEKVVANEAEALSNEGMVLDMTKPAPRLGARADEIPNVGNAAAKLRQPAGPTAPPASAFPRVANRWAGSLPKGSQFQGFAS